MCRSIKTLRNSETDWTVDDARAAALQYVRKISGYRARSKMNRPAFEAAVESIAKATEVLLGELG